MWLPIRYGLLISLVKAPNVLGGSKSFQNLKTQAFDEQNLGEQHLDEEAFDGLNFEGQALDDPTFDDQGLTPGNLGLHAASEAWTQGLNSQFERAHKSAVDDPESEVNPESEDNPERERVPSRESEVIKARRKSPGGRRPKTWMGFQLADPPEPPQGEGMDGLPSLMLLPGFAGSGLLASLTNMDNNCSRLTPPNTSARMWLSLAYFSPPWWKQRCWLSTMPLTHSDMEAQEYPYGVGFFDSAAGVKIDAEDPEGVKGVEYLDYVLGYPLKATRYFHDLLDAFRDMYGNGTATNSSAASQLPSGCDKSGSNCTGLRYGGFEQQVTAFPYDWRLPPWQLPLKRLQKRIDDLWMAGGGKKVVLICHSMGGIVANWFLHRVVTAEWRDSRIAAIVLINPANGGSFKAIRALLAGYNPSDASWLHYLMKRVLLDLDLRELARTFASVFILTPNSQVFSSKLPVASSLSGAEIFNYALESWKYLMPRDLRVLSQRLSEAIEPVSVADPSVPVFCVYTTTSELVTDLHVMVKENLTSLSYTSGDGTLPLDSLKLCRRWPSTVAVYHFKGADHFYALRDTRVVEVVSAIVESFREKPATTG